MHRGYIKLWRKSLESDVWDNPNVWRVWCWCLLKASYRQINQMVGFQSIELKNGQFIFGRKKCAKETRLSERNVRTCLQALKSTNRIAIKVTNKFSIISVINWEDYQVNEIESDQQNDQQSDQLVTSKRPASDHKQEYKEYKESKERKLTRGNGIPDWIPKDLWDDFCKMRRSIKAPISERATKNIISELEKLKSQGYDPIECLNQSITRCWRGVFPTNTNTASTQQTPAIIQPPKVWNREDQYKKEREAFELTEKLRKRSSNGVDK